MGKQALFFTILYKHVADDYISVVRLDNRSSRSEEMRGVFRLMEKRARVCACLRFCGLLRTSVIKSDSSISSGWMNE